MKILYICQVLDLNNRGLYSDLINELSGRGHYITIVRSNSNIKKNYYWNENNEINILDVKIENQFGVNFLKKGLIFLKIQEKYIKGIKKYLKTQQFDLVLYATPPVTFAKVIKYCKKYYKAKTYLMLKDIFPQNAVDIGILKKKGPLSLIYYYFRSKEKHMYKLSDRIGCMSKANIDYLIKQNNSIDINKVELFPNTIKPKNIDQTIEKRNEIKSKYFNKVNRTNFIFGGNLGKPQDVKFLLKAIKELSNYEKANFIIIGKGSEQQYVIEAAKQLCNLDYFSFVPSEEFSEIVSNADVGIVMLDHRFTIPNYPSRVLTYMESGIPILACTDSNTDFKDLITIEAQCGLWSNSSQLDLFISNIKWLCDHKEDRISMGMNGRKYLELYFTTKVSIEKIESFMKEE